MFALEICGYSDLDRIIEKFKPTHIISLIENVRFLGNNHLHLQVSDIHGPTLGFTHPIKEHLDELLDYTRNLTDSDRILVHCFAGQSRSTAAAIAIIIQHGMNYIDAFDHVSSLRPISLPNTAFIKLIDNHFELNGKLIKHNDDYRKGAFQRMTRPPEGPNQNDIDVMKSLLKILQ